jgi:catechol-2,3-dioxygenase
VQLCEVILNIEDMDAQTRFYRDLLGLQVQHESEFWTTFDTGACTLALHGAGERKIGEDAARVDGRDPEGNMFQLEQKE